MDIAGGGAQPPHCLGSTNDLYYPRAVRPRCYTYEDDGKPTLLHVYVSRAGHGMQTGP